MTRELKLGIVIVGSILMIFVIVPYLFENAGPYISLAVGVLYIFLMLQGTGLIRLKKLNINDDEQV